MMMMTERERELTFVSKVFLQNKKTHSFFLSQLFMEINLKFERVFLLFEWGVDYDEDKVE
jgi:hypothetical protein